MGNRKDKGELIHSTRVVDAEIYTSYPPSQTQFDFIGDADNTFHHGLAETKGSNVFASLQKDMLDSALQINFIDNLSPYIGRFGEH